MFGSERRAGLSKHIYIQCRRASGVLGGERRAEGCWRAWQRVACWAVGGLLACLGMLGSGRATGVIGGQRRLLTGV